MSQEETGDAAGTVPPRRELTLSAPGSRVVPVTVDEAQQIRARWILEMSEDPSKGSAIVVKMDIGCRVWSPEALQALLGTTEAQVDDESSSLSFLFGKFHRTLQELKADDIIASLPTDLGLQSLRCLSDAFAAFEWPNLRTINLNDTAVGLRGIQALDGLWRIPALRHLHLQNIGLSAESIDIFVEHLLPPPAQESATADESVQPKRPVPFQTLSLGRNMLGIKGSQGVEQILRNCYQLENLHYAGCRPLREGAQHLADGLLASGSHGTIKVLNLNDGELKSGSNPDDPVHKVAQYLSQSTQLDTLIVSDSSLSSRGIKILLDAVMASPSSSRTLQHLDVGYNVDDDDDDEEDGGDDDGDENSDSDEDGDGTSPPSVRCAKTLAKAVRMLPNLRQLHLYNNDLKDDGVRIVVKALAARGGSTGAVEKDNEQQHMSSLDVLNLCENNLESVDMLLDNSVAGLRELRLADNMDLDDNVDDDQRERLNAMYPMVVWELTDDAFDVTGPSHPTASVVAAAAAPAPAAASASTLKEEDDALAQALGGVHLS